MSNTVRDGPLNTADGVKTAAIVSTAGLLGMATDTRSQFESLWGQARL